jgi:hypothetical protein
MNEPQLIVLAAVLTAITVCFPKQIVATAAITVVFFMIFGALVLLSAAP